MADQASVDGILFDAEAGGAHPPALYEAATLAERIPLAQAAGPEARRHYQEHGWLAVAGLLTPEELAEARQATDDLAHGRVPGFRGIIYEKAARPRLAAMTADERADAVRKLFRFAGHEARMARLVEHPAMQAVIRNLLGCGPLRMFQDMALLKPPRIGREKPWHQDHAFFDFPLETRFLGVWIALDPATLRNGCMHALDRGHHQGPRLHWKRRDFQICDTEMLGQRSVAFPLQPGDAMFFDGLLPHGTPANDSPDRRRALQFHYCPAEAVETDSGLRLMIFGTEGKDATC
ncbi:phytanoyl-CoA dioxygenase family protein [Roseomonas sp. OT10]|uniref:phytanoyl-CoA dioxygenase family protein n=1 Tax=Roseomonas cutis TaxID=2897332 RepID=UPI001E438CE1|nr:phytanoyl-CoA dioxygenase family protein [Roseomonas sp. OT10]UFN48111.1 phytanoyl-CoA dioxygenase family protein [Roseomonas sp. OT10]